MRHSDSKTQVEGLHLDAGRDTARQDVRQREIERLNRLYATLSKLNRMIVRVKTRQELFDEACRIATETAGFKVGWIGWHDPLTHEVLSVARAGDDEEYVDKITVYADDRPQGYGPTGTCVREGELCVFNDFLNDARAAPWHVPASAHGLRATAVLPIRFRGEIWGALTIYDRQPNVFEDKEVALLAELAAAISFGLENLDRKTQRQKAEESLKALSLRYEAILSAIPDIIMESTSRVGSGGATARCVCSPGSVGY